MGYHKHVVNINSAYLEQTEFEVIEQLLLCIELFTFERELLPKRILSVGVCDAFFDALLGHFEPTSQQLELHLLRVDLSLGLTDNSERNWSRTKSRYNDTKNIQADIIHLQQAQSSEKKVQTLFFMWQV